MNINPDASLDGIARALSHRPRVFKKYTRILKQLVPAMVIKDLSQQYPYPVEIHLYTQKAALYDEVRGVIQGGLSQLVKQYPTILAACFYDPREIFFFVDKIYQKLLYLNDIVRGVVDVTFTFFHEHRHAQQRLLGVPHLHEMDADLWALAMCRKHFHITE